LLHKILGTVKFNHKNRIKNHSSGTLKVKNKKKNKNTNKQTNKIKKQNKKQNKKQKTKPNNLKVLEMVLYT
jgi:hypothetical protein